MGIGGVLHYKILQYITMLLAGTLVVLANLIVCCRLPEQKDLYQLIML